MKYTITTGPAIKNTITITRRQLWNNYVDVWSDIAKGDPDFLDDANLEQFQCIKRVLTQPDMSILNIGKLFRDGHTSFLMGDAMKHIDTGDDNTFAEIRVVEGDKVVVVHEGDISY